MKTKIITTLAACALCVGNFYSQTKKTETMKPFKINIEQTKINELSTRINNTRWIAESDNAGWGSSLDVKFLKTLAGYWAKNYDWKKQEAWLNSFANYSAAVDGTNIHFIYEKGTASKGIPVILLHGWAGGFTEYLEVVQLMKKENTDLDIIVPSIPGFGFSGTPASMSSKSVADLIHKLMTETLGYTTYYVHGGDFGAFVAERLALDYPKSVKGIHLSDIPYYHLYGANEKLSDAETKFMEKINNWSMMDGAYAMMQATRPKVLSTGLNDSPMALAAWLLQLYNDFGDKEKNVFDRFKKDALLSNVSIYWFTQTIYSSMRIYSEDSNGFGQPVTQKVSVPVGFNFYTHDISGIPPKEYANRFFENITRWTEQKNGGHFAGMSDPTSLQQDLAAFIRATEK